MYFISVFTFIGIIASAISGALIGIAKKLDIFGVLILSVITSLGGGIIRDILIGNIPPIAFVKPIYFIVSFLATLITCLFYDRIFALKNIILISDAIGLGVFTAVGADTAISHNMNQPFIVVSMGLITGIGGGVLRDIFVQDIPFVFRKEIYAVASILGAISFYLVVNLFSHLLALYVCLFVTFAIRVISVVFNVNAPVLTPKAITLVKQQE